MAGVSCHIDEALREDEITPADLSNGTVEPQSPDAELILSGIAVRVSAVAETILFAVG